MIEYEEHKKVGHNKYIDWNPKHLVDCRHREVQNSIKDRAENEG